MKMIHTLLTVTFFSSVSGSLTAAPVAAPHEKTTRDILEGKSFGVFDDHQFLLGYFPWNRLHLVQDAEGKPHFTVVSTPRGLSLTLTAKASTALEPLEQLASLQPQLALRGLPIKKGSYRLVIKDREGKTFEFLPSEGAETAVASNEVVVNFSIAAPDSNTVKSLLHNGAEALIVFSYESDFVSATAGTTLTAIGFARLSLNEICLQHPDSYRYATASGVIEKGCEKLMKPVAACSASTPATAVSCSNLKALCLEPVRKPSPAPTAPVSDPDDLYCRMFPDECRSTPRPRR
jgi:hypothetical protein